MKPTLRLLPVLVVQWGCASSDARPGALDLGPGDLGMERPPEDAIADHDEPLDAVAADAHVADTVSDIADSGADVPSELGRETPVDVGTQRSCPDPSERGCGLVFIRGGAFVMGGDPMAALDLPPQTMIKVGSFAMDAYEVTVARFQRFWRGGHPDVRGPIVYPGGMVDGIGAVRRPTSVDMIGHCNWSESGGALLAHPVNCLDWNTAQAFCVWDGGRLPTEAEWEFAARGRAVAGLLPGRTWPWGEATPAPTCDRQHWNDCPGEDGVMTRRVGSFAPNGGIYDLGGNVAEWLADWFLPYTDVACWGDLDRTDPVCGDSRTDTRAVRGGSWSSGYPMSFYRPAAHLYVTPTYLSTDRGFRCVKAIR